MSDKTKNESRNRKNNEGHRNMQLQFIRGIYKKTQRSLQKRAMGGTETSKFSTCQVHSAAAGLITIDGLSVPRICPECLERSSSGWFNADGSAAAQVVEHWRFALPTHVATCQNWTPRNELFGGVYGLDMVLFPNWRISKMGGFSLVLQ